MAVSRRTLLKIGAASACVLVAAHVLDREVFVLGETRGSLDLKTLSNKDAVCIAAIAGAVLKGILPVDDAAARLVAINEVEIQKSGNKLVYRGRARKWSQSVCQSFVPLGAVGGSAWKDACDSGSAARE